MPCRKAGVAVNEVEFIKAFGVFLAIMNPFLSLPVFLAMTEGFSRDQQRVLARKIAVWSAVMCAILILAGQQIIGFFGITIDEFRVAGGVVLASIAWSMLNGRNVTSHQGSSQERDQMHDLDAMAFYPLTFPLIVGPGTIATIIIYTSDTSLYARHMTVAAILVLILLLIFITMFFAAEIGKVLSMTMRVITTRLMGMILLAIAVGMVANGIKGMM